jgi:hypothetical protein
MSNVAALIAAVKLTNNGRLFTATGAQVAVARANPAVFVVSVAGALFGPVVSLR